METNETFSGTDLTQDDSQPVSPRPYQWANGGGSPAPRQAPPLNLQNAYKALNFYQEHPEFLASPFTSHAANAHFSAASKVIGMSIQLERLGNQSDSARASNVMMKKSVDGLSTVSALIPPNDVDGNKESGRLFDMLKSPDFNISEFAGGVAQLRARYRPAEKPLSTPGKIEHDEQSLISQFGEDSPEVTQFRNRLKTDTGFSEPTIKQVGGKDFLFYRNYVPKDLSGMTPKQKAELSIARDRIKSLGTQASKEEDADKKRNLLNTQSSVKRSLMALFDTAPASTPATTNAPAAAPQSSKSLTPDIAAKYLNDFSGDRTKAEAKAKEDGYVW